MIRPANLLDITEIVAMVYVDGGIETPSHKWMKLNTSKITTNFSYLISKENPMVYVDVNDKGSIVGCIVGELVMAMFGDAVYSTDYGLYVRSDYRHKRVAYNLLIHFIEESKRLGAERIQTTMPLENFNSNSMEKLLTRKGFSITSKTYERIL